MHKKKIKQKKKKKKNIYFKEKSYLKVTASLVGEKINHLRLLHL